MPTHRWREARRVTERRRAGTSRALATASLRRNAAASAPNCPPTSMPTATGLHRRATASSGYVSRRLRLAAAATTLPAVRSAPGRGAPSRVKAACAACHSGRPFASTSMRRTGSCAKKSCSKSLRCRFVCRTSLARRRRASQRAHATVVLVRAVLTLFACVIAVAMMVVTAGPSYVHTCPGACPGSAAGLERKASQADSNSCWNCCANVRATSRKTSPTTKAHTRPLGSPSRAAAWWRRKHVVVIVKQRSTQVLAACS